MEWITSLFSAFGLSASAGLNAYIPLLVIALLGRFTNLMKLQEPWDALTSWWVIGLLVILSVIEFFADKVPAINHINDAIQSFIRPAAGAVAFAASAGVVGDTNPVFAMAVGVLVAGGVHATKSLAVRPAVTATTGGAGNVPISILEDLMSSVLSLISVILPILVVIFFFLTILLFAWWLWRRSNRRTASLSK